jgi:hypothetical protein
MEELTCPLCKITYDSEERTPRFLFKCGHTICQNCLKTSSNSKDNKINLTCPEDKVIYEQINGLDCFPKNVSLLKIIQRRGESEKKVDKASSEKENESPFTTFTTFTTFTPPKKNVSEFTEMSHSNVYNQAPIENNPTLNYLRASFKKSNNHHDSFKSNGIMCSIHFNRPLEVICIDHKVKICTNCALFGEHKNHKIVNEEDFLKEIEIKAEILIELFELVEYNLNQSKVAEKENNVKIENILKLSDEKFNTIKSQINNFTSELIVNIKKHQVSLLDKISSRQEKIKTKVNELKDFPKAIYELSESWKISVQSKLDKLNEISENSNSNEEFVKLIETNISDQDLITTAENIIAEFGKIKNFPLDKIEEIVKENRVEFDYENANKINVLINYIEGKTSESVLNLDKSKNELNLLSTATDNNSIFTTSVTNEGEVSAVNNMNLQKTGDEINESFINLSEDSSLIKINNSIILNEPLTIDNREKTLKVAPNSTANLSKNDMTQTKRTSQALPMNTIKIPVNSTRKEKSKSPKKHTTSLTPEKDKVVFIKSQLKNESANFTGVGNSTI